MRDKKKGDIHFHVLNERVSHASPTTELLTIGSHSAEKSYVFGCVET
jgi:hypothetical protein